MDAISKVYKSSGEALASLLIVFVGGAIFAFWQFKDGSALMHSFFVSLATRVHGFVHAHHFVMVRLPEEMLCGALIGLSLYFLFSLFDKSDEFRTGLTEVTTRFENLRDEVKSLRDEVEELRMDMEEAGDR